MGFRFLDHDKGTRLGQRAQDDRGNRLVHAVPRIDRAHPHAAFSKVDDHARTAHHVGADLDAQRRQPIRHAIKLRFHGGIALRLVDTVDDEVGQPLFKRGRVAGAVRDILNRGLPCKQRIIVLGEATVGGQVEHVLEPSHRALLLLHGFRRIGRSEHAAAVSSGRYREEQAP